MALTNDLLADPIKIIKQNTALRNVAMSADFKEYANLLIQELYTAMELRLIDDADDDNGPFRNMDRQNATYGKLYKQIADAFDVGLITKPGKFVQKTIIKQKAYASAEPNTRGIVYAIETLVELLLNAAHDIELKQEIKPAKRILITRASITEKVFKAKPEFKALIKAFTRDSMRNFGF